MSTPDDEAVLRALRAIAQPTPKSSRLPGWPPKDWRALIALVASVAGAAVLTGFAGWLVWIIWRGGWPVETADKRIEALARALLGVLLTVSIVLISLGLAINRRTVKGSIGVASFEASGGEGEDGQQVAQVTTTTKVSASAADGDADEAISETR